MGKGPFNNWYHVVAWTYGQWVRGDLRGWRARQHREHCDGDYRHRPDPGAYARVRNISYGAMKRDSVRIESSFRRIVLDAVVEELVRVGIEVLCAELDAVHLHLLARFPRRDVRRQIGWAKLKGTTALKAHCAAVGINLGLHEGEGIWGKRCGVKPICDRAHQLQAFAYILAHEREGGVTWIAPVWADRLQAIRKWVQLRQDH